MDTRWSQKGDVLQQPPHGAPRWCSLGELNRLPDGTGAAGLLLNPRPRAWGLAFGKCLISTCWVGGRMGASPPPEQRRLATGLERHLPRSLMPSVHLPSLRNKGCVRGAPVT